MINKSARYLLFALIVFVLAAGSSNAGPPPGKKNDFRYSPKDYKRHGYVLDHRHKHDRYYPKRGSVVRKLPPKYRVVKHRHSNYYFSGGVWFRPSGSRFIVSLPPVGMVVPFLPYSYTTVWVGGAPYYYAAGAYYAWAPEYRAYRVVRAPADETAVSEEPEVPDKLFVYPKQGQGEEQQALDRYECHNWARSQTGFDPTQPGGGVDTGQNESKRNEYNRAMKACLEARGYSVQ